LELKLDICKEKGLLLLLDTGAEVSVVKSHKLIGSTRFDPQQAVKLKSVDGSIVETHEVVNANIREGELEIPMQFQLINKQVDIEGDGILGKDFLQNMKAQICYGNRTVKFKWKNHSFEKQLICHKEIGREDKEVRTITLKRRSETIVQVPVDCEDGQKEGLIEKREIKEGIYVASSLTTVKKGYALTSILNTNDREVEIPEPRLKLARNEDEPRDSRVTQKYRDRGKEVLEKLRLEHLNSEEKRTLEDTCLEFQDIFHLPGEELTATNATTHSITVVPGTAPINIKPYRLPEAQKAEIEKQVDKLLGEGVIEESDSLWNSPLLVVPKKINASGEEKMENSGRFPKAQRKDSRKRIPPPRYNRNFRPTWTVEILFMCRYGHGLPPDS
jgi:hypothetical protein